VPSRPRYRTSEEKKKNALAWGAREREQNFGATGSTTGTTSCQPTSADSKKQEKHDDGVLTAAGVGGAEGPDGARVLLGPRAQDDVVGATEARGAAAAAAAAVVEWSSTGMGAAGDAGRPAILRGPQHAHHALGAAVGADGRAAVARAAATTATTTTTTTATDRGGGAPDDEPADRGGRHGGPATEHDDDGRDSSDGPAQGVARGHKLLWHARGAARLRERREADAAVFDGAGLSGGGDDRADGRPVAAANADAGEYSAVRRLAGAGRESRRFAVFSLFGSRIAARGRHRRRSRRLRRDHRAVRLQASRPNHRRRVVEPFSVAAAGRIETDVDHGLLPQRHGPRPAF